MARTWQDVINQNSDGFISYPLPETDVATLRFWVKLQGADYTGNKIFQLTDTATSEYLEIVGKSADLLSVKEYPGGAVLIDDIPVKVTEWQQLVIQIEAGEVRLYQNGAWFGSANMSITPSISEFQFTSEQPQIYDEMLFLTKIVTPEQIKRWYEQTEPDVVADPGGSYEEQYALGTLAEPTGVWSATLPVAATGEYLWMRKRWVDGDGTPEDWSDAVRIKGDEGPQGPQGPPGNPGELGIYADGTTLHVKGFAEDGTLTAPYGYLYVDGARQQVNAYSQALTNSGQGYVLYDGSTIHFAKLVADTASSRWVSYNTLVEYSAAMWVIGSFMKTGDTITDIEVLAPERMDQFELRHFMEILHTGDINDINVWAQANGVGTVFEKIAVLEAFVDKLMAVNLTAGFGNGTTGGFRFRAMSDRDMDGSNDPVFDVMYDDRKLFEVNPSNGNVMFGNYNPSTKSGGILYDYVNDKLLGNVAYDQWDLVIESDADFDFLQADDYTVYKRVLITAGTYNLTKRIALTAHQVEVLYGMGQYTTLKIKYDMGNTNFLDGNIYLKELGNFTIDIDATQTGTTFGILYINSGEKLIDNLKIVCSPKIGRGYGIRVSSLNYVKTLKFQNCYVSGLDIAYHLCGNSLYCIAEDNNEGFDYCHYSVGCNAKENSGNGFYRCEAIAACVADSNNYGFYKCYGMGGCSSFGNTTLDIKDGYDANKFQAIEIYTNTLYLGASIGTNGYSLLPNGLLLQWGAGTGSIKFPIAFSTVYRVVCSPQWSAYPTINNIYGGTCADGITNSGFTAYNWYNNYGTAAAVYYMAIGV